MYVTPHKYGECAGFVIALDNGETYTAQVHKDKTILRFGRNGEVLDKELTAIVVEDIKENASEYKGLFDKINPIVTALGYEPLRNESNNNESYKQEFKLGFRDWQGKPNSNQYKLLAKYSLEYVSGNAGSYGQIRKKENPKEAIRVSNTPSDINAGKAIARDIVKYLVKYVTF